MPFQVLRRVVPLAVALALTACVDLTGLDIAGGHLISISVDNGGIVEVGDTVRLGARGRVDGLLGIFSYDRILDATWAVSDPNIAQLQQLPVPPPQDSFTTARTLVRGRRPGTVIVKAIARGVSGEAPVRVIPVVATIQLIVRDTISVGDTIFVSTAVFDAGGAQILDVPLTFGADGSVKLVSSSTASARIVALVPGPGSVSVRFRHATETATLVVVTPLPQSGSHDSP